MTFYDRNLRFSFDFSSVKRLTQTLRVTRRSDSVNQGKYLDTRFSKLAKTACARKASPKSSRKGLLVFLKRRKCSHPNIPRSSGKSFRIFCPNNIASAGAVFMKRDGERTVEDMEGNVLFVRRESMSE